jgi:LmbE family N-acetylglucosaminyl deacetylase
LGLRLFCAIAHPDDECFAFGGALALAADHGAEISIVCFTDGKAGSYRGTANSREELGILRRKEFADSCRILGIQHFEVLDYEDGKLEFSPLSELAGKLVERIRSFRPHVVLTFGLDGAPNTHADHTTISAAASAAFHWAGSPKRYPALGPLHTPQRLFHQTSNFFLPGRLQPLPAPWTLTLDITPVFQRKVDAFRAHTTQVPLLDQVLPLFEEFGKTEVYTLIGSPDPQPATQSADMFEGVLPE